MKPLFYPVFVFFAALIASVSITRGISQFSKFIAWREFIQRPKGLKKKSLSLRMWFNFAFVVALTLGLLFSWIFTHFLSFGVVFILFVPVIFRFLVRYRDFQSSASLEASALSFFSALLGLIKSGRGLPSSLFDLAQSQTTPFSEKLRKHLRNYEEGRGLSRILTEFNSKTRLPVVGIYLASLEMAYRQGLEIAPLLEKMIPTLEMEHHFRRKIEDLRRQISFQALLAFLIPWILSLVLWLFNPEVFRTLAQKNVTQFICLFAFSIEITGIWVLWQLTRFV